MINDAAFELVTNRAPGIMRTHEFNKFEGTPAIRVRYEADFLQALKDHCNSNQPFLFGCDSCNVATKFYHACSEGLDESLKEKCCVSRPTLYIELVMRPKISRTNLFFTALKLPSGLISPLMSLRMYLFRSQATQSNHRAPTNRQPDAET